MTARQEHQEPDARLLMDISNGNHQSFETFYHRYETRVYHYLLNLIRDQAAAEEVLADVMVAIWDSAKSFKGEARVSTWVFGIARHKALDALRRIARHERTTIPIESAGDHADPQDGPIELLLQAGVAAQIKQAMEALSSEHREVLHLAFYEELSYQDIAKLLEIPVNTVKTRVFYAKQHLKQVLHRLSCKEQTR